MYNYNTNLLNYIPTFVINNAFLVKEYKEYMYNSLKKGKQNIFFVTQHYEMDE